MYRHLMHGITMEMAEQGTGRTKFREREREKNI